MWEEVEVWKEVEAEIWEELEGGDWGGEHQSVSMLSFRKTEMPK